jgi:single-stranded DNA-binding protein
MADQEFKNYDTSDRLHFVGARLAKDAEVRETKGGKMVRITAVSTSRNEGNNGIVPMWIEFNVNDFQADLAEHLKKGDVLYEIYGHPYMRKWGESDEKVSICVDRAQLVVPPSLFATLKERGFSPGKKDEAPKAKKPAKKVQQELPED